jgi:hypothetical protein
MQSLNSAIIKKGKYVTQIIHFVGGIKRTYHGVITDSIKQGQFTKFECKDGTMIMVNDDNVLCIEVFSEKINAT